MTKLIRFDWAIKNLLRDKANFEILEGFLSELLNEDIKILNILESESNQQDDIDKFNRVDLLVQNSKNELIIIEVQNTKELDYLQRILYGTSKTITENIEKGQPYSNVKKIISVSIAYFNLGEGDDYVYRGYTKFKGIHNHDQLNLSDEQKRLFNKEDVYQIFPEYYLIRVNKFDDETKDKLDQWIYFLKNEEVKDEFDARGLRAAKEKLDVLKLPKNEQIKYKRYLENLSYQASIAETINFEIQQKLEEIEEKAKQQGELAGMIKGKLEGKLEGIIEGKLMIAKQMKEEGLSVDLISKLTLLNIEEIENL